MAAYGNPNENESEGKQSYPITQPQPQPTHLQATEAGEHSLHNEGQPNGAAASNIGYKPAIEEPYVENQDCFRVVRSSKFVEIPCTRNEYRKHKVRVAKQVSDQVPKRVEYTDYEIRERQEPYSVKRFETAYREEDQEYTVQVPKTVTRMVKVKKKVPKTVYVDIVVEEPREETIMVPETRKRSVKVPYQKEVVDQKYRTVKESVPVTKYRTEYDTVAKTVYEDEWRTKVVPVTKLIQRELPVYNVVRNEDCNDCTQVDAYPVTYEHEVETYPPYVEAHPEPMPSYYEPPVNNAQIVEESAPAPVILPTSNVDVAQVPENIPVKELTPVMNNPEYSPDANVSEPQDEQKVAKCDQKWLETQYSAPAEYDTNNDGILDAHEREVARADGNLNVERIAVVQNPKDGRPVVEEELYSQPQPQPQRLVRKRRRKKNTGRRRRRNRR